MNPHRNGEIIMPNIKDNTDDPEIILKKANELLDMYDANHAMVYFWSAGKKYLEKENWEMAGFCFFQSAYCYEIEGNFEKAAEDYLMASEYYIKANLAIKAKEAINASENIKKNMGEIERKMTIKKTIIGAVGLNGSGKDMLLIRIKAKYGIPLFGLGDEARELAKEENIEPTRENLHEVSVNHIKKFGSDYFPRRVIRKIEDGKYPIAGVSGIRTTIDAKTFKDFYKENFILVAIEVSDPRIRFERLKLRADARDAHAYEEFLEQDKSEEEIFKLTETFSLADVKINNDGSLDDFNDAIDDFIDKLGIFH
jgi:dephospho-CoA kinase